MGVQIYSFTMLQEITNKLYSVVRHNDSAISLSYKQALAEKKFLVLDSDQVNILLDEMKQQISDNKATMQDVLGKQFDYFENLIDQRALGQTMAELFHKGLEEVRKVKFPKPTPSFSTATLPNPHTGEWSKAEPAASNNSTDFAKMLTAKEAKEIAKNNQRDYAILKDLTAEIKRLSFEGKYRHVYQADHLTAFNVVHEKLTDLGYRVSKIAGELSFEISWD